MKRLDENLMPTITAGRFMMFDQEGTMEKAQEEETPRQKVLTPREIVCELDKYIIGQDQAKRSVAIALAEPMAAAAGGAGIER
jgi:ATP-dependent protease Clp ATPase subunit